jgi:hypothetical protein
MHVHISADDHLLVNLGIAHMTFFLTGVIACSAGEPGANELRLAGGELTKHAMQGWGERAWRS